MKKAPRTHKVTILLNDSEQRVLDNFCTRYKVQNRSKLVRETLMRAILKQLDEDSPTLF